jgi:hypothetical protein
MGQQAVLSFLMHWLKCQEDSKQWPLKFLKPDHQTIQGHPTSQVHQNNDATRDDEELTPGNDREGRDDGGKGAKAADDEDDKNEDDDEGEEDEDEESRGGADEKGKGKDITDVPGAPDQVATPLRKFFLKSLSTEAAYQKLIRLLDMADVSDGNLMITNLILTNSIARC